MNDVTGLMNDYRECVRHLWNTYCLKVIEKNDWDFRDRLNEIEIELFRNLVLYKIERENTVLKPAQWRPEEVMTFLKIEAESRSEILINRESGEVSGYWDDPLNHFWNDELDLRFIHYFDWTPIGFRDFAYYKVRIVGSQKHLHLVGRDALLPVGPGIIVLYDADA
jgi:hypothetical protein